MFDIFILAERTVICTGQRRCRFNHGKWAYLESICRQAFTHRHNNYEVLMLLEILMLLAEVMFQVGMRGHFFSLLAPYVLPVAWAMRPHTRTFHWSASTPNQSDSWKLHAEETRSNAVWKGCFSGAIAVCLPRLVNGNTANTIPHCFQGMMVPRSQRKLQQIQDPIAGQGAGCSKSTCGCGAMGQFSVPVEQAVEMR